MRLGPPGRCRPHDEEVAGGAVANLGLLFSAPREAHHYHLRARARALMARQWSARCYGVARQREGSRQNSIGGSGVLSLRHFGLVLFIPWRVGAEESGAAKFRSMASAAAALTSFITLTRARALMARQWSA